MGSYCHAGKARTRKVGRLLAVSEIRPTLAYRSQDLGDVSDSLFGNMTLFRKLLDSAAGFDTSRM